MHQYDSYSEQYYYNNNSRYNNQRYKNKFDINSDETFFNAALNNNYKKKNKKHKKDFYSNNKLDTILNKINKDSNIQLPEHTSNLIFELSNETLECMICNEKIKKSNEIWSCKTCYTVFHLKCTNEWINKKLQSENIRINQNTKIKFTCPHCNSKYELDALPIYDCYCGKYYSHINNKKIDEHLIPHGCGLRCGVPICRHIPNCTLPCHPGPHLQCKRNIEVKCYCGKNKKELPCSLLNEQPYCCNEICGKQLPCGKKNHLCKAICHEGSCSIFLKEGRCDECIKESKATFINYFATIENELKKEYKVDNLANCLSDYIFNGKLPCGIHLESNNDYENSLKLFQKLMEISGSSIADNLKRFIPICQEDAENSCACKSKTAMTKCFKINYPEDILNFLGYTKEQKLDKCNKVCKTLKNCKIHKCNRICCELRNKKITNFSIQDPNGYHLCLIVCNKPLSCGKHNCPNYCHKGACKPCATIIHDIPLYCTCKKTCIEPPYVCGSKVICNYPCSKKRKCEHPCPLQCHEGDCPKCEYLTIKKCRCNKTIVENVVCGDTNEITCKNVCECMLNCGVHFCPLICHNHTEEYDQTYVCSLPCNRKYQTCNHICKQNCHGESECDEYACSELIEKTCKCGHKKMKVLCGLNKKKEIVIECDESCAKAERLKKIEEAFKGLSKISEEKIKLLYPNSVTDGSEEAVKEIPKKYYWDTLGFAVNNIRLIIKLESIISNKLFEVKNKIIKNEKEENDLKILIENEDSYSDICEWFVIYHNLHPKKVIKTNNNQKQVYMVIQNDNFNHYFYQPYKLSLMALLFKKNLFIEKRKLKIFHPFKYTILLKQMNIDFDYLEELLLTLIKINKEDFYLDEFKPNEFYIHFFDENLGRKMFAAVKSKFEDYYEITYNLNESEINNDNLYLYLKDENYFNMLDQGYDSSKTKKSKVVDVDEEGFTAIINKKKK